MLYYIVEFERYVKGIASYPGGVITVPHVMNSNTEPSVRKALGAFHVEAHMSCRAEVFSCFEEVR